MAKNKNVITIPATRQQFTSALINEQRKRRIAAYARVNTDHEDQQNSYEAQIDYYTGYTTVGTTGNSPRCMQTKVSRALPPGTD